MSVIIGLVVKVLFKGSLRVSAEEEAEGLMPARHGESAYPAFNGLDSTGSSEFRKESSR